MRDAQTTPAVLIDARELAAMLSVSVPTVWRMRESGRLPEPLRLTAQTIRWRRADIDSWLTAGCPDAQSVAFPQSNACQQPDALLT
jgi:predicted DNA-binding transcriptional regulator AlpA